VNNPMIFPEFSTGTKKYSNNALDNNNIANGIS